MLFGLGYAEIIPLPWEGVLRGVCLANHLASTDNLTTSNQETEHIKTQTNVNKESGPNKQQHTQKPMLRQRTDTAWFSAFYDIRPGNGVGLFLQPGACLGRWFSKSSTDILVYGMSNQSEFYCSKRRWRWRWWQPFALSRVRLPLPAFNTQPLYGRMPFLLCWFVGWLRGV